MKFLIDRRYIKFFDFVSFFITLILATIGLLFIFSATYRPDLPYSLFFKKQFFGVVSGILIYFIFCFCDYRNLQRWSFYFYFLTILLLIFTFLKGSVALGGQRWINLGIIKFQPSDLTKLLFPGFFTYYLFSEKDVPVYKFKDFMPVLLILGFSFLLILKQPDLGTGLILVFSASVLLWLAGIGRKFFITSFLLFLVAAPLLWKTLKPYQKQRIAVFLGQGDSRKERYQIEQSLIAIGSGGLTGKGFLQGTQNKLMFLPESRTDCIFAVFCEEMGFVGALFLLSLFFLLFLRIFYIISTIKNFYAQLLACGLVIHIVISTLINIGMVIGFLPIVGIQLPFMTYGITYLWITFASLGWFNGIAMRRFYIGARK